MAAFLVFSYTACFNSFILGEIMGACAFNTAGKMVKIQAAKQSSGVKCVKTRQRYVC